MATPYIVIGCPTTGGGQVISGNNSFLIEGIPIACVGDKATCPKHKTVSTIITGDPYMQVIGKAAARVNDSLSCGCKLLPKQNLVVQDNGSSVGNGSQQSNTQPQQDSFLSNKKAFKAQFEFLDQSGNTPLEYFYYLLTLPNGEKIEGITDKQGKTKITEIGFKPEDVKVETFDLSQPLPPLE
ncbi:PAAR domain-containing protein [Acinetobacter sp. ANC 3882]|uniref:PAAR domain-containing protein n=1 Tax=Acinetobacter sp. ANC 3882 TaxID=2923423 RepID=UPI001F4AC5CD|nr:PAAR domain-containing protein [Acinetobacter sp. ANC 3882]MCH7314813.1 PAAR domain-containing protein [Acinetobacter sp. ANC 3882]